MKGVFFFFSGKVMECDALQHTLLDEYQVKDNLENKVEALKLEISRLRNDIKIFEEQNNSYAVISSSQEQKSNELTATNEFLNAELQEKKYELENLLHMFKEGERNEHCMNENLQSTECMLLTLEKDMKEIQEKYISLQEDHKNLKEEVSMKEKDIIAINTNFRLKEDGIQLLLEQVESLNQENTYIKTNESVLYTTMTKLEEDTKILQEQHDMKVSKLTESHAMLNADLKERNDKLDNMLLTIREKEVEIKTLNENLQSTELNLLTLEKDMKEIQEKYISLQEHHDNLKEEVSMKEEYIIAINTNFRLKEDSIQVLLEQVESLNQENTSIKTNESVLYTTITKLEEDTKILQEQHDMKVSKLTESHTMLNADLKERNVKLENMLLTIREKEVEIKTLNENLNSKVAVVDIADNDRRELEEKYNSLMQQNAKLQITLSIKEEDNQAINFNIKSKEDSINLLFSQIENLNQEKDSMKKNECSLNLAITNYLEQIDIIALSLKSKEDTVGTLEEEIGEIRKERNLLQVNHDKIVLDLKIASTSLDEQNIITEQLKEELNKIQFKYENNLNEAEEMYNDLQKRFENSQKSESDLQILLNSKHEELSELLVERKSMILKNDKEILLLNATVSSNEETFYHNIEEKDKDFMTKLLERNSEIEKLNIIIADLELYHQQGKNESDNAIEDLKSQLKILEQSLHHKDEELLLSMQVKESFDNLIGQNNYDIDELKSNISIKEDEVKTTANELNVFKEKEIEWNTSSKQKDCIIDAGETQVISLKSEIEKLTKELGEVVEEKVSINIGLIEKESELVEICSHFESLIEEKVSNVNDLSTTLKKKEEVIIDLLDQLENANVERALQIEQFVSDKTEMNANFEAIIHEKEGEIMELNSLLNTKNDIITDVEGQILDISNKQRESADTELILHQSDLERLQMKVDESLIFSADLQQTLKINIEEKEGIHESLVARDELICKLHDNLKNKLEELDLLQSNYHNNLQESEKRSNQTINDLYQQIAEKNKETDNFNTKASKEIKDLNKELKNANSTIIELKKEERSIQENNVELKDKYQSEVATVTNELNAEKKKSTELMIKIDEMTSKRSELELTCKNFEEKITKLEHEIFHLQNLLSEQNISSSLQDDSITKLSLEVDNNEEHLGTMKILLDSILMSIKEESNHIEQKYCELRKIVTENEMDIENYKLKVGKLGDDLSQQMTKCNDICSDLTKKEEEVVLLIEENNLLSCQLISIHKSERSTVSIEMEKPKELHKQLDNLKREISTKEEENNAINISLSDLKQQLQASKEKTARSVKKYQAMKKIIIEKEKDIYDLKASAGYHLSEGREVILQKNDFQILHTENESNKDFVRTLESELEIVKDACKKKDIQISELNNIISQFDEINSTTGLPQSFIESSDVGKEESVDGSTTETSITATTQELEWDPSGYTNKSTDISSFSTIDDAIDEPLCNSMSTMFSDIPKSISEIEVLLSPKIESRIENKEAVKLDVMLPESNVALGMVVKDEETNKLTTEIEQVQHTLYKYKKKNAILKKAQIELAKEIELLQELPKEQEQEVTKQRENVNILQEQLKLSGNSKIEVERKMKDMQQLVILLLDDEEWHTDDVSVTIDRLLKSKENDNSEKHMDDRLQDMQTHYSELQYAHVCLTEELKSMTLDCQRLVDQKLEKEEVIEGLKLENQKFKNTNKNQSEAFLRCFAELTCDLQGENDIVLEFSKMVLEDGDKENKAFMQILQDIKDRLLNERIEFIESLKYEKLTYQETCEEAKVEALQELEIRIKKESNQEIECLKKELNLIIERQLDADNLKEQGRSLKNQALEELELLRTQLVATVSDVQHVREASQECENKLLGEIERELIDVNERLQASNAMKDEIEAAMKCEELLKQQYKKENDILKSEINVFKEEQQLSNLPNDLEEVKKHKDLVIKKLKIKLRKEISEKEKSISEATKMSSILTENGNIIQNLEQEICKISNGKEETIYECMRQIAGKDDLIKALKDELSWLKDSMVPLVTKAENADKLLKDNQSLKVSLETKDDELVHLKEHALLKENELTYLIDQEKHIQDEYLAQKEKLKLKHEEKETTIKVFKDEIQWLQTQINDLSPKAEQLISTLDDLNLCKENLCKEISLCQNLENQLHAFEIKMAEKENMNHQLVDNCNLMQEQLDNLLSNKDEVEELNSSFKEMEELYSSKNEVLAQVNESLHTREAQLEDLRTNLIEKTNAYEELQGMLQNKDVENRQICTLLDQERQVTHGKELFIEELSYKLSREQEQVSLLNNKITEIDQLLGGKTLDYDDIICKVENLEQVNLELKNTEDLYLHQKIEFEEINQALLEKDIMLTKFQSDNSKQRIELERLAGISKLSNNLNNLLAQFGGKSVHIDNLQENADYTIAMQPDVLSTNHGDEENVFEAVKRMVEENNMEVTRITNLFEGKGKENVDLIAKNSDLLQKMEIMQHEHESSINQLQESISKQNTLYYNSLQEVKMVKEIHETERNEPSPHTLEVYTGMNVVNIDASVHEKHSDDCGLGWDDAYGWENIGNLESNLKCDDMEILSLKEEIIMLNGLCDDKDNTMLQFKEEAKEVISERDILREKCKSIENITLCQEEISVLKEAVEKLKADKELKQTTIAKLKVKLKQTIRGRDQLKENLQSELDRISQEKDLIFNEFSEKLQQQNVEIEDLRNGSEMLSKTLEAVGGESFKKEKELESLQLSLNSKIEIIEQADGLYNELKCKYDEIINANTELNVLINEKDDILKKQEVECSEKDDKICGLDLELSKAKDEFESFEDIRYTLEEAMAIKDRNMERAREQMETLQKEYVKLNAEFQLSLNKCQSDANEYEERMTCLNKKMLMCQEAKENITITAGEYKAELEAVEILFGLSDDNDSLIELVSSYKIHTTNKLKEYERLLKDQELENNNIHLILQNTENLCNIPNDDCIPVIARFGNIQNAIHTWKEEFKLSPKNEQLAQAENILIDVQHENKMEILDLKGTSNDENVAYQLLENKIQLFTTMTEELQKKMDELHEKDYVKNVANNCGNEDNSLYLKILPAVIEEISLIKLQLENDISYSKVRRLIISPFLSIFYSILWDYGVVVCMFDFHHINCGSYPGQGDEIS